MEVAYSHVILVIQGINNYQMTDILIAMVGGIINTQHHGKVLAITYQYTTQALAPPSTQQPSWNGIKMVLMIVLSRFVGSRELLLWKDVIPLNIIQGIPPQHYSRPTTDGNLA